MKKLAFVLPHMLCGGVEKALLALINELPEKEYNITIFLAEMTGEFVKLIPENVKVKEIPFSGEIVVEGKKAALQKYVSHGDVIRLAKVMKNILMRREFPTLTMDFEKIPEDAEEYDTAICFHIHMPVLIRYTLEKIKAARRIAWVHNDFASAGYDITRYHGYLAKYNHIFCVSEQLQNELISLLPDLKGKTSIAHNIVSPNYIKGSLDGKRVPEYTGAGIKLLTVGRLESQKGIDIAIQVAQKLSEKNVNYTWYVLGDGSQKDELCRLIKQSRLEDRFILLGTRLNPYPYFEQCDIYVQPSRHEGYGIAVAEARALHKPIICTDFTGAREQIRNGKTGLIVSTSTDDIFQAVYNLINDADKRTLLSENLRKCGNDSQTEVNAIIAEF